MECQDCGLTDEVVPSSTSKHDAQETANPDVLTCSICARDFAEAAALKRHLKNHKSGKKIYYCGECGKDFAGKTGLGYHMTVHTGEKAFSCELCGKRFTQRPTLNYHMKTHQGIRPFACEICGKKFQRRNLLDNHMSSQIHTPKKQGNSLKCIVCKTLFTTKESRDLHIKTHEHFTCPVCEKVFLKRPNLTQHMKEHLPHTCDACGKVFPTKSALRKHKNMYNDPEHKPFQCDECGARFVNKLSIKDHMQNGHRDEDAEDGRTCDICGEIFSRKFGLKRHMKKHPDMQKTQDVSNVDVQPSVKMAGSEIISPDITNSSHSSDFGIKQANTVISADWYDTVFQNRVLQNLNNGVSPVVSTQSILTDVSNSSPQQIPHVTVTPTLNNTASTVTTSMQNGPINIPTFLIYTANTVKHRVILTAVPYQKITAKEAVVNQPTSSTPRSGIHEAIEAVKQEQLDG